MGLNTGLANLPTSLCNPPAPTRLNDEVVVGCMFIVNNKLVRLNPCSITTQPCGTRLYGNSTWIYGAFEYSVSFNDGKFMVGFFIEFNRKTNHKFPVMGYGIF